MRLKKFVAVRMNYMLYQEIKEVSDKRGRNISDIIREFCNKGLRKK